ncbi:hypothetical protein A1O3_04781 [Capronia epimyces CBS 606.96]|uniref:Uncharacterized protein n=1 Tax=Capronia epimyces CBS 606.96 TaxID=1182542 RepID=W9YPC1_9EURO|nr:uncharacterized protein A1O3_04781 [Capronia epimyces CBS 606.96]EXJ84114.1 hypothetical protein A1O3_04781 [Capronia epimyces CBS 606.96]
MPDIARRRVISASPSSPAFKNSPPFEELGCFDEESCRYFLREVGRRVVPFYPFTFGMEEVYSLILERFGYPGIPDVTSVLQELLENDDVAGGFGDDGDIWRSWRHSWRHRNDDSLNPFIPKIGNFILQAPTEPHIRRIKAQNFIRQSERACSHDEGTTSADRSGNEIQEQSARPSPRRHRQIEDEDTYILPATTFSHQRTRTMLASGNPLALHAYGGQERPSSDRHSVTSAASSQQEFIEVEPSNLNSDIDPSLLVSFEMLTNDPSSPAGFRPNLRGGQAEVVTLQQVRSESGPTDNERASGEAHFAGVEQPAAEAEVADTKVVHDQYGNPAQGKELDSPKQEESMDDQYGNPAGEEPADDDDDSLELARPFAGAPAGREPTLSMRTRAMNREFRLIDGAIFHPRARKRVSSQNNSSPEVATSVANTRRASVVRRSWTPVRQRIESRSSWLKDTASHVLTLFRKNSQEKKTKSS